MQDIQKCTGWIIEQEDKLPVWRCGSLFVWSRPFQNFIHVAYVSVKPERSLLELGYKLGGIVVVAEL